LERGVEHAVENGITLKPLYTRPLSHMLLNTHHTLSMNHGYSVL
jgi:hypothetical protein